jgi:hypothetical protein
VSRILAVTDQVTDPAAFATQSTEALFDAFEAKPVARLAAWLELTGESRRLTTVREAVRSVLSTQMVEQTGMCPPGPHLPKVILERLETLLHFGLGVLFLVLAVERFAPRGLRLRVGFCLRLGLFLFRLGLLVFLVSHNVFLSVLAVEHVSALFLLAQTHDILGEAGLLAQFAAVAFVLGGKLARGLAGCFRLGKSVSKTFMADSGCWRNWA